MLNRPIVMTTVMLKIVEMAVSNLSSNAMQFPKVAAMPEDYVLRSKVQIQIVVMAFFVVS